MLSKKAQRFCKSVYWTNCMDNTKTHCSKDSFATRHRPHKFRFPKDFSSTPRSDSAELSKTVSQILRRRSRPTSFGGLGRPARKSRCGNRRRRRPRATAVLITHCSRRRESSHCGLCYVDLYSQYRPKSVLPCSTKSTRLFDEANIGTIRTVAQASFSIHRNSSLHATAKND